MDYRSSSEYLFPAGQDLISILQVTMRLLVAVIARPGTWGDNSSPSRMWESSLCVISLSDLSIASHWQLTAQTNATRGEWCFNYRLPRIWENLTARNETEEWPGWGAVLFVTILWLWRRPQRNLGSVPGPPSCWGSLLDGLTAQRSLWFSSYSYLN